MVDLDLDLGMDLDLVCIRVAGNCHGGPGSRSW